MKNSIITLLYLGILLVVSGCASVPKATLEEQKHELTIQFIDLTQTKIFDGVLNGLQTNPTITQTVVLQDREHGRITVYVTLPWAVTGLGGIGYDLHFTMTATLTDKEGKFMFTNLGASSSDGISFPSEQRISEAAWFHSQANTAFRRFLGEIIPSGINGLLGDSKKHREN